MFLFFLLKMCVIFQQFNYFQIEEVMIINEVNLVHVVSLLSRHTKL